MSLSNLLFDRLRAEGFRVTKLRRATVDFVIRTRKPFTVQEVHDALVRRKLSPNLTTIYREVDFLVQQDFLRPVHLGGGSQHYELVTDHHHHIVCRSCGRINEVTVAPLEEVMPKVEAQIKRANGFSAVDHSLEFFGICNKCA